MVDLVEVETISFISPGRTEASAGDCGLTVALAIRSRDDSREAMVNGERVVCA